MSLLVHTYTCTYFPFLSLGITVLGLGGCEQCLGPRGPSSAHHLTLVCFLPRAVPHTVFPSSSGDSLGYQGLILIRPIAEAPRRSAPSLLPPVDKGVESRSSDASLMPGRPFLNHSHADQLRFIATSRLIPPKPHSGARLESSEGE